MYNRYVHQPDGTYQKRRMQENLNDNTSAADKDQHQGLLESILSENASSAAENSRSTSASRSAGGFLRQLLPKEFDTGDLLVILLLLLMSGEGKENKNTALLTLALYLFM